MCVFCYKLSFFCPVSYCFSSVHVQSSACMHASVRQSFHQFLVRFLDGLAHSPLAFGTTNEKARRFGSWPQLVFNKKSCQCCPLSFKRKTVFVRTETFHGNSGR